MPGRYRVNGANIFNHNEKATCPRCGRTWELEYFLFRNPYVRREECVLCQVEDEKAELKRECYERRLMRAEEKRRRDLMRRIKSFRALQDRRRNYMKALCKKQGIERFRTDI